MTRGSPTYPRPITPRRAERLRILWRNVFDASGCTSYLLGIQENPLGLRDKAFSKYRGNYKISRNDKHLGRSPRGFVSKSLLSFPDDLGADLLPISCQNETS